MQAPCPFCLSECEFTEKPSQWGSTIVGIRCTASGCGKYANSVDVSGRKTNYGPIVSNFLASKGIPQGGSWISEARNVLAQQAIDTRRKIEQREAEA